MRNRFETFATAIPELNRFIQRIKDLEMRRFGLRANHAMCLYYLGTHEEGLNAAQMTRLCGEDKAAISRCLAQLREKGLVTCEVPENKRAYRMRYTLTAEGQELVKKINMRIEAALFNGGSGMDDAQREVFYRSLEQIRENLALYIREQEEYYG